MGLFSKLTKIAESKSIGSDATFSMMGELTSFNENTGQGTVSWSGNTYQINANPQGKYGLYEIFPFGVPSVGDSVLFNIDSTKKYAIQVAPADKRRRWLNHLEILKEGIDAGMPKQNIEEREEQICTSKYADKMESAESEIQWNQPKVIIECSKSSLLKGINLVLGAVPSKSTIDILECILIDAFADTVKLLANNMEFGIETVIEGKIISKGIIALNAKLFYEIISKLPDGNVTIEADSNYKTVISCKGVEINITGKAGEKFTILPYIERKNGILVSQLALKEVIKQTIFSVSGDGNNKLMTGELFEIDDNILKVVSLDGHRISMRKINIRNSHIHKKLIISGTALIEISKILSEDTDKNVRMFYTDEHVLFEFDNTIAVSKLIQGEYFKIDQMISTGYETKIIVSRREMLDCINLAMIFITGNKIPIIIEAKDDGMKLHFHSDVDSMYAEIKTQKSGKDIMIGFNPRYLMDVLGVINSEEVNFYLSGTKAPCLIRDDENQFTYLILPVNIQNSQSTKPDIKPRETTIPPVQAQDEQKQTTNTTPPVQTQSILDTHTLFDYIKDMPIKWEYANPNLSPSKDLQQLCNTFLTGMEISKCYSRDVIMNMEYIIQKKRARTPNKEEYNKVMERNILFELYKYSYYMNFFKVLEDRKNDKVDIDSSELANLIREDCIKRFENMEYEKRKTPAIQDMLQKYKFDTQGVKMIVNDYVEPREYDYIYASLMTLTLLNIVNYVLYSELKIDNDYQPTIQIVKKYPANDFIAALDTYLASFINLALNMYTSGGKLPTRPQ